MNTFRQELYRSYASGPDIYFGLVDALRTGRSSVLGDAVAAGVHVRLVGRVGDPPALVEFHHDRRLSGDGAPLVDGYFIRVGQMPVNRPRNAVLTMFQSEAEAMGNVATGGPPPEDTDDPRFRYYELAGTGTGSRPIRRRRAATSSRRRPSCRRGSAGCRSATSPSSSRTTSTTRRSCGRCGRRCTRGSTTGCRCRVRPRISARPGAPDGIARDEHGNALGGIRTPWVDVPDAFYAARISPGNPLAAGKRPFTDEEMNALYGSRDEYERRVRERFAGMVQERVLLPGDGDFMFP